MLHKTLDSYYRNDPYPEEQEHPDGPLWLCTKSEVEELPRGTTIERTDGVILMVDTEGSMWSAGTLREYAILPSSAYTTMFGLRGYREE